MRRPTLPGVVFNPRSPLRGVKQRGEARTRMVAQAKLEREGLEVIVQLVEDVRSFR